jgi:galactokinase
MTPPGGGAGQKGGGVIADMLTVPLMVRLAAYCFEDAYATPPAGVWRAPGALVLFGGPAGTAGTALSVGLPWGVIVAAAPRPDRTVGLYSMNRHAERITAPLDELRPGAVPAWAAPCARALIAAGRPGGADILIDNELPAETALLTGAETQHAVELALRDLYRVGEVATDDPVWLAARHARSAAAVLAAGGQVEHLPCDLAAAGLRLLIVDVGAGAGAPAGSAGDVARAADVLRAGDLTGLGPVLTSAHRRDGSPVDLALAAALEAGALGGRMIGRCGVLLAPSAAVPAIRARVTARMAALAPRAPRFLTAVPAAAARRVAAVP